MDYLLSQQTRDRLMRLLGERGADEAPRGRVRQPRWAVVLCLSDTAVGGNDVLDQCYPAVVLGPSADTPAPPAVLAPVLLTLLGASGAAVTPVPDRPYVALLTGELDSDATGTGPSRVAGRLRAFATVGDGDRTIESTVAIDYITDVAATFTGGTLSITKTRQTITDEYDAAGEIVDRVYGTPEEIEILNSDICTDCGGCAACAESGSQDYPPDSAGDHTFTATCSGLHTIECWGPSGDGGQQSDANTKAGGGGGGYSRSELCLEEGVDYTAHVGAAGATSDHTRFKLTSKTEVLARSGLNGSTTGGLGGKAADGIGQVKFDGGDGGDPGPGNPGGGGGGGGGAGSSGNGSPGAPGSSGAGGAGGTGGSGGGGNGGNGGAPGNGAGVDGSDDSGGGGGGGSTSGNKGHGRNGRVLITW